MSKFGKIISILNLLISLLLLVFVYNIASIVGVLYSPIGILISMTIIIVGLINSILFFKKNDWDISEKSKIEIVFFLLPLINTFVILLLGSMMGTS
jgi:hypothetical protein